MDFEFNAPQYVDFKHIESQNANEDWLDSQIAESSDLNTPLHLMPERVPAEKNTEEDIEIKSSENDQAEKTSPAKPKKSVAEKSTKASPAKARKSDAEKSTKPTVPRKKEGASKKRVEVKTFKATPFNRKIVDGFGQIGLKQVKKKAPTKPVGFKFASDERIKKRHEKEKETYLQKEATKK